MAATLRLHRSRIYARDSQSGAIPNRTTWSFRRNWEHTLAKSNRWNIDLLADLAEVITFRVSRRRREMYSGHGGLRMSVSVSLCVSVCPWSHSHTTARTGM